MAWNSEYLRERHAQRRSWAIDLLGGTCARCGGVERADDSFEFDHVDPSTKTANIGDVLGRWSEDRLRGELESCQLLHHSCHKKKSRESGDHAGGQNKILDPEHGTWAMYANSSCRCDDCRRWKSLYRKGEVDARGNRK